MLKILKYLFKAADEFFHSMGWLWEDVFFFFLQIYRLANQNINYIVFGLIFLAVGWYIYLQKE